MTSSSGVKILETLKMLGKRDKISPSKIQRSQNSNEDGMKLADFADYKIKSHLLRSWSK